MSQIEALEQVKSGEIAATALIAGKPVSSMLKLSHTDNLHFVPIPYPIQLISDYLPTTLTHDEYPELVAAGDPVDTVAVGAVLIAYNWPKANADRYRRVNNFVEAFFSKIALFQKPHHHVKWREVSLGATLPGWTRFPAAQAWLDNQRVAQQTNANTNIADQRAAGASRSAGSTEQPKGAVDQALYQEFLRWRQRQGR